MSGYLQRLAGSVMKPKETVRPLLGSIYASNAKTSAEESFEDVERESTKLVSAQTIVPSNETARPIEVRGELIREQDSLSQSEPEFAVKQGERRKEKHFSTASQLRVENDPEHKFDANQKATYIPLLTASSPDALNQPMLRVPTDFSSSAQSAKHRPAPSQSAQREPDEIQIHIGRIEVSAVTQQAPVAVARTPRTPSSLDEYLQRRDRRRT